MLDPKIMGHTFTFIEQITLAHNVLQLLVPDQ
jgi:hypothetical protein